MSRFELTVEGVRFECRCWEGQFQERKITCFKCGGALTERVWSAGNAELMCSTMGCHPAPLKSFATETEMRDWLERGWNLTAEKCREDIS